MQIIYFAKREIYRNEYMQVKSQYHTNGEE